METNLTTKKDRERLALREAIENHLKSGGQIVRCEPGAPEPPTPLRFFPRNVCGRRVPPHLPCP